MRPRSESNHCWSRARREVAGGEEARVGAGGFFAEQEQRIDQAVEAFFGADAGHIADDGGPEASELFPPPRLGGG